MRNRSIGVMTLSVGAIVVGLYCQMATVALLISGSTFFSNASLERALVLGLGLGFLAVTIASYAAAYGFWARKSWSWSLGVATFTGLIVVSVSLALLSMNLASGLLPSISAAIALWYLHKPAVRGELPQGTDAVGVTIAVNDRMKVARHAH